MRAMEAEEVNERFFKQRERNIKTDRLTTKFKESCTNMEFDIADAQKIIAKQKGAIDDIIEELNHLKSTKLDKKVFEQNALSMEG